MKLDLANGAFTGPSGFKDPVTGRNILFTIAQGQRDSWAEYYAGWAHNGGMPVVLNLLPNNTLGISPIDEVKSLRQKAVLEMSHATLSQVNEQLKQVQGDALDIEVTFSNIQANSFGLHLRMDPDRLEDTFVYYDMTKGGLYLNRLHSSLDKTQKDIVGDALTMDKQLSLRILLDRSLIEIYANGQNSLTSRVYPTLETAKHLEVFAEGGEVEVERIVVYPMGSQ